MIITEKNTYNSTLDLTPEFDAYNGRPDGTQRALTGEAEGCLKPPIKARDNRKRFER